MRRTLLYLIVVPILLIIAAALLIPLLVDEDQLLELAVDTLQERTGAQLTVAGEASLDIFPGIALKMTEAELALPGEGQPDLSARSLAIGVKLWPLLSGNLEIEDLALEGLLVNIPPAPRQPSIDTSEMSDAELDAYYAARREALKEAGNDGGATLALPLALEVKELSVTGSRVVLLASGNGRPTVIDIRSLEASDLNLDGRPVPLALSLSLPGDNGDEPIELELETRFTLDSDSQQLQLSALEATLAGATGEVIHLGAEGSANLQRMAADLELALEIGPARGEGTLRYASFESPQIDASLHFNQLSPALLALAGTETADDDTAGEDEDGGDEPLPLNALRNIDTRAALQVDKALIDGHEIHDLQARLRAVDGVINIRRFSGRVHGGTLELTATLDAKHNRAGLETRGKLEGVDLPQLLAALEADPVATGQVSLDWELGGNGSTPNQLRDSLEGPIGLHTADLVLKEVGVERMFCGAVALVNRESLAAELSRDSAFEALTADLQLAEGKARLAPLRAELKYIALAGTGEVDLSSLAFDADFAARLDPGLAELDPACRVNERYTAIDWPLECKGQLDGDPGEWCSVDSGEIIEDLTRNEVERKVQEKAGKLFDKLLDRDKDKDKD